jgi:glycosyltransferase involved in cell wall biosynthesis
MEPDNKPFISVIIPTFNRLGLLKETVESVRRQTFRDFEIIVINDGSTDGTTQWLDTQTDIRSVHQINQGIAASRNNGAATARGSWLAFLDHDDTWAPEKLSIQAEFVRNNPDVGLVAARHARMGKRVQRTSVPQGGTTNHGNETCPGRASDENLFSSRRSVSQWVKGDLFVRVYSESFIHTSSVMIRADVLREINGFPTEYRFADEFDVWLKIAAAYPIAYVDSALTFIRFYESNTSHNRVGVRADTYRILLKNYDPARIPKRVFLRTMSDHDISFGRAFLKEGNTAEALKWFRKSVQRTPLRLRSWRYLTRYGLVAWLERACRACKGLITGRLGAATNDRVGLAQSTPDTMAGQDGSTHIRSIGDPCGTSTSSSDSKSSRLENHSNRSSTG